MGQLVAHGGYPYGRVVRRHRALHVITPLLALSGGTEYVLLVTTVVGWVVGIGMNVLLAPFYISLPISIYWDLKLRKDGGDLAARVGALNPA